VRRAVPKHRQSIHAHLFHHVSPRLKPAPPSKAGHFFMQKTIKKQKLNI
jgi:hypothetical protein